MRPDQVRAIDFHKEYNSTDNNRLTRFLSGGSWGLLNEEDLYPEFFTSSSIKISDGYCIKDDSIIQLEAAGSLGYHVLDLTDPLNYIPSKTNPTSNILDFHGYWPSDYTNGRAYIVLEYDRIIQSTPVQAQLKILKDPDDFDSVTYLFIGTCFFSAPSTIINPVLVFDQVLSPYLNRQVFNYDAKYTDDDARLADAQNLITNHAPVQLPLFGKVVSMDEITGNIIFVESTDLIGSINFVMLTWTGTTLTVNHNYGNYPHVMANEYPNGERVWPEITHISLNSFTIDLALPASPAYNFYIQY